MTKTMKFYTLYLLTWRINNNYENKIMLYNAKEILQENNIVKQIMKTQKHYPKLRTNMQSVTVAIKAKISNYSNNIKVNSASNKVNSNNKMTNPACNCNK